MLSSFPRVSRRLFSAIVAFYLASIIAVAVAIDGLGDTWWPATAAMFAPRWVWGLPLLVLVPLAFRRDKAALAPLALAAIVFAFPILDLRVPVRRLARLGGAPRDLRVMTYNVGGGRVLGPALSAMVADLGVDLVALQEREGGFHLHDMHISCRVEQCLGSRYSIRRTDARDRKEFADMHGSGAIVRYEVETPRGRVDVTNVHLATVRDGLSEVMKRGPRGAAALDEITRVRRLEAEAARAWATAGENPVIVVGDFNTPVESSIYRASWSSFENAFSLAGLGLGSTKRTRWHGVRIDHILVGPGLEVVNAWVGPGLGGDHRPVIADLRFVRR